MALRKGNDMTSLELRIIFQAIVWTMGLRGRPKETGRVREAVLGW